MRCDMLDYRIYTFLTLYDEMNYRKTAEKLNMTQPGVTQHIHYLEKHYGVKLFEYNGRSLSKTLNAEILKKHIDCIRAEENEIVTQFTHKKPLCLRIGATKTIGEFVISPDVCRFLESPDHTLQLHIDNTDILLSMLENSEIDFAVIEGVFDKSRYGYHLMKKERFVGICADTHPFADKKVRLNDIFKENLILRERGSGTRRIFEQALNDKGFTTDCFSFCSSISNFSVICDIVSKTGSITFGYEPVAKSRSNLACFEVEDMQINGEFNYVYCNERIAKEKIKEFSK